MLEGKELVRGEVVARRTIRTAAREGGAGHGEATRSLPRGPRR